MNGKRRLKEAKYMNEHGSMHNLKAAGPNNPKKRVKCWISKLLLEEELVEPITGFFNHKRRHLVPDSRFCYHLCTDERIINYAN